MNGKPSRRTITLLCLGLALLLTAEASARGGRGGGFRGGGGGGYRGGGGFSRSPSMSRPVSRPSVSRPVSRPSVSRPSVSRPSVSRPSTPTRPSISRPAAGGRPAVGARPAPGSRPATGARPAPGTRPSQSQLQNFLDLRPGGGSRPSFGGSGANLAAGAAGGAAAAFLRDRPSAEPLPARRPVGRPGLGDRPGAGERPSRPTRDNRPDRIDNRQQRRDQRVQRRDQVHEQFRDNRPRFDFWVDHPSWAAWRLNRPYRWATWVMVTAWFPWGWSQPASYSYGENVYYEGDSVYYGDQVVATSQEYAQQAQTIATGGPGVPADTQEADWLSLGVFAITQDGQASGPPPTLYLQLQVNKDGVITGTLQNMGTNRVQQVEGVVDKRSQRSAWTVAGKSWPVMETGISDLTQDQAPALVHFEDGQTQQWLLVRMDDPDGSSQ